MIKRSTLKKIILVVLVIILIKQVLFYEDLLKRWECYGAQGKNYDDSMLGGYLERLQERILEFFC